VVVVVGKPKLKDTKRERERERERERWREVERGGKDGNKVSKGGFQSLVGMHGKFVV